MDVHMMGIAQRRQPERKPCPVIPIERGKWLALSSDRAVLHAVARGQRRARVIALHSQLKRGHAVMTLLRLQGAGKVKCTPGVGWELSDARA